ncbi:fatty acyl-CoA reductase wat-like isoform X2 [Culicoides brevitarsis]|uniref:fatty acyl-CoA reductase wat-like isoform X2 n=1 Tax=Culicoides brevitarsis TaxID=469753 RepID=UPI00307B94EF
MPDQIKMDVVNKCASTDNDMSHSNRLSSFSSLTSNMSHLKLTELQRFYTGANIFITGGTGFMGKMLLEKLLRTCTGIENIYLLIRPKKNKDIHTRIDELFDDLLFEKLKNEVPKFRHKLVAINGDCGQAGLGISLTDRQTLMQNVNIVIHAAATVRFDEKLKLAISINVHGTKDILSLCNEMKHLKSVIHVSTAYSNCHLRHIEEKFYQYPIQIDDLENLVEKFDDEALAELTPRILGNWPNTYAFTKALAEDVVRRNCKKLPLGIFRPAIVTSSAKEPVIGWIDNLYGPTGVVAGAGTGILRTMHCDKDINANIVPVDYTVNALIASVWDVAKAHEKHPAEEIPIYNYVSSVENPITWGDFTDLNINYGFEFPFSSAIWYLSFRMHRSAAINSLYMLFLHFLPALLIDSLAMIVGQKPRLLKIYKKVHKFSNVISFFCTNEWVFTNNNVQKLWLKLDESDQKLFDFNLKGLDWFEYLRYYIRGMRVYLMKDDLSTLEASKRKWNRFYWLHQLLKLFLAATALYFVGTLVYNFSH